MPSFLARGIAAAASLPLAPVALAQTTTLPPLTVTAPPAAGSLTVPGLELQREQLERTAGSVGFIDTENYKGRYSSNLRDVLQDTPGIYVQNRYGQELRVSVRGSGMARGFHTRGVEILQDGVPTNSADGSGDFYQIDPLSLRSAEVYKGANGLAYGASTLGGAINFVTPTAYTAIAPNVFRLEGGSFGTMRGSAQVSRTVGPFDMQVSGTVTHADGYREHMEGQYEQVNANVGYRITPDIETRFYLGAYIVDQKLPGALTLNEALNTPKKATAAALSGDQARDTRTLRIANGTTFRFDVGQLDLGTWAIHKSLFHPIFQVIDQDSWTYGAAPRYSATLDLGGNRNDVILGGRAYGGTVRALQYVNANGSRGAQTANTRQEAENYEAYVENRHFFLPTVALTTGLKLLHQERDYTDQGGLAANPVYKSADTSYDGVNPKVGLLWEPEKTIQAFVNLSRSQDVPDFSDLTQTTATTRRFVPLASQHAWTVEIGSRGRVGRFAWDATAYRSEVRDELMQFTTDASIPAATFNADKTVHQGIELAASAELFRNLSAPGDRLTLTQLWNWNDFRFQGDRQYGDNRIAGVPQHVLRTTLAWRRADGFYLSPSLDWVPEGAYADQANSLKVPSYALFGFQAGIDFENGLSLFLDARNLADKRYVSDIGTVTDARRVGTAIFYPGDGRAVYAGLRYAF